MGGVCVRGACVEGDAGGAGGVGARATMGGVCVRGACVEGDAGGTTGPVLARGVTEAGTG
jgi:hypothetical protein